MIRILPNSYNKEDLEILQDFFDEMANTMQAVYCEQADCRICKHKRVCYDIDKANEFLAKEVRKHDKEIKTNEKRTNKPSKI